MNNREKLLVCRISHEDTISDDPDNSKSLFINLADSLEYYHRIAERTAIAKSLTEGNMLMEYETEQTVACDSEICLDSSITDNVKTNGNKTILYECM